MTAIVTREQYETERAICDKANAYWKANATFSKGGCSSMGPELSAHPDYSACTNDIRARVEQYELNRDKPERFTAYVSSEGDHLTCWTGLIVGRTMNCTCTKRKAFGGGYADSYTFRTIWGDVYRGFGACGLAINLKRVA